MENIASYRVCCRALVLNILPNETQLETIIEQRTHQYRLHKKHTSTSDLLRDQDDDICNHSSVWCPTTNELLAAARIISLGKNKHSETELYTQWPKWFPQREDCVDVARLFVASKAKDMKTVECLFRGIATAAIADNKRYITGSCTRGFIEFYKKNMNAKFNKLAFSHGTVGGSDHFMFYADME